MDDLIVNDGPEDRCFGCGQRNEKGLRLRFKRTGERSVEVEYTAPAHYGGPPGIVHGGIQATLLDEVCGMAVYLGEPDEAAIVTASFNLRYRRPVHLDTPLTVKGWVARIEGPNFFAEGEICSADGEVLTSAEARWRRLE
jgi:uncharacterized protein (TIGR00369 family)